LAARGGTDAGENIAGIRQVRAFIEAHGSSRFEAIWEDAEDAEDASGVDTRVHNRAGFRKRVKDGDGEVWDYYVLPEVWRDEVCRGHDPKALAKVMIARGLLVPGDGNHFAKSERVPGYTKKTKKMRLYHIPAAILAGDDHD
jgi:uncharacterized protein (DUF927 family)